MASIRKHRTKWQVQVRRSGYPSVSRSFSHKTDAEAWARKTERGIDSGDLALAQRSLNGLTLHDLLVRYRDTITPIKRGATMERYKVGTLLTHPISDCPLRTLTPLMIAKYRDDRLTEVKSGTVRRELSVLHHCLEVARKEWDFPFPVNPVGQVAMPQASKPRDRRPSPEELKRLLNGCRLGRSQLLASVILFAIETGMRRGELVATCWTDVNLENRTLHIPTAERLSPHDPLHGFYDAIRSLACFLKQDYEQAVEWAGRASRRPIAVGFWPYALLASGLSHLGRAEEAKKALDECRKREPDLSLSFVRSAVWWSHEHLENYFEGIREAGLEEPDQATVLD